MAIHPPAAIVRYPASAIQPIIVGFEGVEVQAAIATREVLNTFNGLEEFNERGVYVLLSNSSEPPKRLTARPGMAATQTLNGRLRFHLSVKPSDESQQTKTLLGWETAVLFRRVHTPFGVEQASILEALLHDQLDQAVYVERVGNRNNYKASDLSLQGDIQDRLLPALLVGLRLAGVDLRVKQDVDAQTVAERRHRPGAS